MALESSGTGYKNDVIRVNGVFNRDPDTQEAAPVPFGAEVVCTDDDATHWLRDGRVVAYGSTYTHYAWDGSNIYSSHVAIENKPLVVLEDTSVDGAYMIEYDKGDADSVIEAGIIFGSSENIIIGSTDGSKAASQRNNAHGQFCASPNGDVTENYARGYLIYEKNNIKYIIYTDAMAV